MKKLLIIIIPAVLLIAWWIITINNSTDLPTPENQPTKTTVQNTTPTPQNNIIEEIKIIPANEICSQISKEYVTRITGISIERVTSINDTFINACNYYLTNDKNSPYIAIVVNKNLNFEKHKEIAQKNKLVLKTDPSISGNHFIAWADNETRISNINLFLDENSFLRIDRNVERAVNNDGLIKLASALSNRF
jgi:hypothetical protein